MSNRMHRIFISSTFKDLEEHRKAAREAIRQLGAIDISMENFGARDNRPKDECFRLIQKETDVFVGVYAHRYGFIPERDDISITESEYREAARNRLPIYVYIIDDNYAWIPALIDQGQAGQKLLNFKAELRKNKIVAAFTTSDNLASKIAADLGRHFSQRDEPEPEVYGLLHQPPDGWLSPVARNRWSYKVAAFDLDGTLLRGPGYKFSWEAVWKGLSFGKKIQNDLKREYSQRIFADSSKASRIRAYQDWCDKACAEFKRHHLTRSKIRELCEPLALTQRCRETLVKLREEGVVTAIISGGINTFLEDKFPDFREYVDFAFINELIFDASDPGLLQGVRATAYDFQGKADALDLICEKAGCSPAEAVFVGDRFNDEAVMLKVNKAIAYPPMDEITQDVSNASIVEDDLMLILPHILVE